MRNLTTLVLLLGVASCGASTDPSASGVFPTSGFLGGKAHVEISGDATEWNDSSKVNFGDGVTVDSVTVASPTALFADITIAPGATLGAHDVVVTGGDNVTLKAAFTIESPITVSVQGNAAQGSIAVLNVVNHDFDNPFDTTSTGDGLFSPLVFTNLSLSAGNGVQILVDQATPFTLSATVLIDTDAQSGAFSLTSGPTGATATYPLGKPLDIAPRTAMALTAGTAMTFTQTNAYDTGLYEFTPATNPALARFQSGSTTMRVAILPASGHFADLISAAADQRVVAEAAGKFYVIPFDLSGGVGTASVKAGSSMLTIVQDTEPGNSTSAGATACTLPCYVKNATLGTDTDQDWFKFTAAGMDVSKKLHVTTMPGDDDTDTQVTVFNGATQVGTPVDADFHEDFATATVLTAGTYNIKIDEGSEFDVSSNHYDALLYTE